MDYIKLYEQIPKEPRRWCQEDMATWLEFIGLSDLNELFGIQSMRSLVKHSIDGSCLDVLTDEDLMQLGIHSGLKRKKLLQWIKIGLKEYKQYVKSKNGGDEWSVVSKIDGGLDFQQSLKENNEVYPQLHQNDEVSPRLSAKIFAPIKEPDYTPMKQLAQYYTYSNPLEENNQQYGQQKFEQDYQKLSQDQLQNQSQNHQSQEEFSQKSELIESQKVIEPPHLDKKAFQYMSATVASVYSTQEQNLNQNKFLIQDVEGKQIYTITDKPFSFGRAPENQVILQEDYVSRNHCQVFLKNEKWYLQDLGSTSGTFIQLIHPTLLRIGLILHIGSTQLQIISIYQVNNNCDVIMLILDGKDMGQQFKFSIIKNQSSFTFGRVLEQFKDDLQISGKHAIFTFTDDGLIVEDQNSRNGTWLRLSEVQKKSEPLKLSEGRQFRLGYLKHYTCIA